MRTVLLLAVVLLLVGCTHIEYVDRPVYVYPDRGWVRQVDSATPPDKAQVSSAPPATQVGLIGNFALSQSTNLSMCNAQLGKIEQWMDEHQASDAQKK